MNKALVDPMEDRIDAFEQARLLNPQVDLHDFLPAQDDAEFPAIAVELMRIDLEGCWRDGAPKSLDEYQRSFASVLCDRQRLSELAFEEYRCRLQSGAEVTPQEYVDRFGIPIDQWPASATDATDPWPWQSLETIDDLGSESNRLVDAIQPFPEVGDRFQNFQLVETLGQGTFGTVFRAEQSQLADRAVVLKISAGHSLESQHLARLQHTNIVPIYSTHEHHQLQAVCMPFFGRTTLADVVRRLKAANLIPTSGQFIVDVIRDQPEPNAAGDWSAESQLGALARLSYVDAVVQLLLQVVAGLEHAHLRGILHRDIKPANVLLTDDGRSMILDFNISDEIVVGGRTCLLVGGTWPYMSPEQRRAMATGQPIDQRSDIFSLGVLLYQLLCRNLPADHAEWQGGLIVEPNAARVDANEIRSRNPLVPRSVAAIVCRCLQPDRDRRYQTVGDLKQDLERHLEHLPLRFAPDRSPAERVKKWCRRHPWIVSASTILTVASILLIIVASAAVIRDQQFKRARVVALAQQIDQELPQLRVVFGAHDVDADLSFTAVERVQHLIDDLNLSSTSSWADQPSVRHLRGIERSALRDDLAELFFLLAAAEFRLASQKTDSPDHLKLALKHNESAQRLFQTEQVPVALIEQQSDLANFGENIGTPAESPDPKNVSASPGQRMMRAQQMMSQGKYATAVTQLEELRAADPYDFSAWFLLGNCYASLERLSDADACFTTCVALWPGSYLSWFNRGLCRFQLRRFGDAKQDFDQVLELRSDFAPALFNRALCQKSTQNFEAAIDDLSRVVSLQGNRPRVLLVRSRVYEQTDQATLALADREAAFATQPMDAKGWLARGLARVGEEPELALIDIQRAQQLAPHSRQVSRNLAYVYGEHLDQPQAAADILASLVHRYEDPTDMMSRAVMLARTGQQAAAIQQGELALKIRRDGKLVFQMACVHALGISEDSAEVVPASAYFAEAISLDPRWLNRAASDADLDALRQTNEFQSVVRAALMIRQKVRSNRRPQPDLN